MRPLLIFRLVFLAAAAIAAFLLLTAGGDADAGEALAGRTTESHVVMIELDGDGRPRAFDTHLHTRCPGGHTWSERWAPVRGLVADFVTDGNELRVRETDTRTYPNGDVGHLEYTLDAVVEDERAVGTVHFSERVDPARGSGYTCDSGEVTFTAR